MTRIRISALLVLVAVVACAKPQAEVDRRIHSSPLGYRVDVPPDWTIVDRAAMAKLDIRSGDPALANIDPAVIESVRSSIATGDMEFFFLASGTKTFRDNINVLRAQGSVPASRDALPLICASMARQLSEAISTTVAFDRCQFTRIRGNRSLVMEWGNSRARTRTIQYHLPLTSSTTLVVTGMFTEETGQVNGGRLRTLVEAIVLEANSKG